MANRKKRGTSSETPSRPEVVSFVSSIAKQTSPDPSEIQSKCPSAVNDIIEVLRNQGNNLNERAVAARALGLLMERDSSLHQRMKLESDTLVDSLLQVINLSRHEKNPTTQSRKVHVNCCLVISMIMNTSTPYSHGGLIALSSDLLKLEASPASIKQHVPPKRTPPTPSRNQQEESVQNPMNNPSVKLNRRRFGSSNGRRQTTFSNMKTSTPKPNEAETRPTTTTRSNNSAISMKSMLFGDEGRIMGLTPTGENLPIFEFNSTFSGYGVPQTYYPFHRPNTTINPAAQSYDNKQLMRPTTINGPSRAVKNSHAAHSLVTTPTIIYPSKLYRTALESGDRSRPFVMPPDYMLEMLQSNQMPLSLPFSRNSNRRSTSSASRIAATPWGEVDPIVLDSSFTNYHQLQSIAHVDASQTGEAKPQEIDSDDANLDINSKEYKRRRLVAILHVPIESTNNESIRSLAIKEHSTNMRGFSHSLHTLRDEERILRNKMSATILLQRNSLPLKFLFELPGGIGYCRDRLQTSMRLWIEEFEVNQQRAAWLQWKALVEQFRFKDRMGDFVRQAALKRMKLAMDLMVRAFLHKGWVKWVFTTQIDIWTHRDVNIRRIQSQIRRFFDLKKFIALHDASPVGGELADIYLDSPRSHLPFQIPLRVRLERRQLWFAAISVQAPYRGRRFRKFMRQQRKAAIKIQALVRRRQMRAKYLMARRNIILIQAHIRRRLARKVFLQLKQAAMLVQRNLRGRIARKFVRMVVLATRREFERKWQAVLPILRILRGHFGRQAVLAIRNHRARRLRAALLIQKAWYTYNNEWTTFMLLGCLREREVDEKHAIAEQHQQHLNAMAQRIQHEFSSFVCRQRELMAVRIQQRYRIYRSKCKLFHRRIEEASHRKLKWWFRSHHNRRNRVATKLQFWWRKSVPGRMLRHLSRIAATIQSREIREQRKKEYSAATTIQAIVHGVWTRYLVKKKKCAIIIQRNWRRFHAQMFVAKLRYDRRIRIAKVCMERVYREAFFRVLERRHRDRTASALKIQSMFRGQWERQRLAEEWFWHAERTRMAQRVQRLWRQTSEKRFAVRLLALQRRRVSNPYKDMTSIPAILTKSIEISQTYFDPYEALAGLNLIGWLRRLGLDDYYDQLHHEGYNTVASLKSLTEEVLKGLFQIKEKDTRQLFLTAIHYRKWLDEAASQRDEVAKLERTFKRLDKKYQKAVKEEQDQHAVVKRWEFKLEKAKSEAADFKHPPKAARNKLHRAEKVLIAAEKEWKVLEGERNAHETTMQHAKERWTLASQMKKKMEGNEIKAVFLLQATQFIDSYEEVKKLFLDHFPNMEFRAVRFIESLQEKPITMCQLIRFFSDNTTISDIKLNTNKLIYCKYDPDIAKHDHSRLQQCTDALQYAVERIGDIIQMPIVTLVDMKATSPISMVQAILFGLQEAKRQPLTQRPRIFRECLEELKSMQVAAGRVQHLWRTRQGRQMVAALRDQRLRHDLKESYAAERDRQSVRRVWEDDLKKAQAMQKLRQLEEARAAFLSELQLTLQFGYNQEWHEEYQIWYYIHSTTGEMIWERPSYDEKQFNAVKPIQKLVRRFLGTCRRLKMQRTLDRWSKYEKERVHWESLFMDRRRYLTLRTHAKASGKHDILSWRREKNIVGLTRYTAVSPLTDVLEAMLTLVDHAYHRSVRKEHLTHLLMPVFARPRNVHADVLIDFLQQYAKFSDGIRPSRAISISLRYTRVEMPFGWSEIPQEQVYYYNETTGAVSWDEPEYTFEEEYAARKLQSAYRMLQGRKAFRRMLYSFSFVDLLHASIHAGAAIGWVGFGLEGMALPVYLSRLGLVKQIPAISKTKLNMETFWHVPEEKWLSIGVLWSKEEKELLASAPRYLKPSKRLAPLTGRMTLLSERHGFHIISTEKILQQKLTMHFTGQQGRVQSILRAFQHLQSPISHKQLELYIRGYTGRPAQAAENVAEILPQGTTTEAMEVGIFKLYRHALKRCGIVATNLKLTRLATHLHEVIRVTRSILGVACDLKLAISSTPLAAKDLEWVLRDLPLVKGLWESNVRETKKLSVAQAALWLRKNGLEFVLRYIRSTIAIQATFRMYILYKWYKAVVQHRNACALSIQLAWRCCGARAIRDWLRAEQASEYEQHFVEVSQLFFYVYVPTQERMQSTPVDAYGDPIPFRPMVVDRLTRKWILSWPWLASSNQAPDTASNSFESNVVCSICDNEKASRVCDVCSTPRGDYIYYCFACYSNSHPPSLAWHTYQPLNRLHAQPLRCVECTRLSSYRCLVCKEDYCDRCYTRIHSKGKRANHLVEHYEPRSRVCIECEQRIALKICTVCADALCEDCALRTHSKGNKAKHLMEPIRQPLAPGEAHCIQCLGHVADKLCRHCQGAVCHVCLETTHEKHCLESQFEAVKKALLGDNICVDCGKPADRICETCGDKYCSARWMGNPGCFERYHSKGKRIEHIASTLEIAPIQLSPEAIALERKIKSIQSAKDEANAILAKEHADKLAVEQLKIQREQKAFEADIQRAKRAMGIQDIPPPIEDTTTKEPKVLFRKPKKQAPRCRTLGCPDPALRGFPFCKVHCTAQSLLEMGNDTKQAAKIMALFEKRKQQETMEKPFARRIFDKVKREFHDITIFNNDEMK